MEGEKIEERLVRTASETDASHQLNPKNVPPDGHIKRESWSLSKQTEPQSVEVSQPVTVPLDATDSSDKESVKVQDKKQKLSALSLARNEAWLQREMRRDQQLVDSKYLPIHPCSFIPQLLQGPRDIFEPPIGLWEAVKTVFHSKVPIPAKPKVLFGTDGKAVEHNTRLLASHGYNLKQLLEAEQSSTMGFGLEFRPIQQLRLIIGQHPGFGELEHMIQHGMPLRFVRELLEDERLKETNTMITRGNHKSATKELTQVQRLLAKDVSYGFLMTMDASIVLKIPHAMAQPLGLVHQGSIDESGRQVMKMRLTQDSSFSLMVPDTSVNNKIDLHAYPEMIYRKCLSRILHFVVALWSTYLLERILITKFNFSNAYRRMLHSGKTAAQLISIIGAVAFITLRLTFGGSPNPLSWCNFSEPVTDLSNKLLLCKQ